jgi:thiamine biosynthesis lipoprotein
LTLTDLAVATSGDYRNVRELDGSAQSHLFDPETGESISSSLSSVTVIAEDCATADAYATAAMVMGIEAAVAWLESVDGVEAVFISQGAGGAWVEHWTSGARAYEVE